MSDELTKAVSNALVMVNAEYHGQSMCIGMSSGFHDVLLDAIVPRVEAHLAKADPDAHREAEVNLGATVKPTKAEREEVKRIKEIAKERAKDLIYCVKLNRANLTVSNIAGIIEGAIIESQGGQA